MNLKSVATHALLLLLGLTAGYFSPRFNAPPKPEPLKIPVAHLTYKQAALIIDKALEMTTPTNFVVFTGFGGLADKASLDEIAQSRFPRQQPDPALEYSKLVILNTIASRIVADEACSHKTELIELLQKGDPIAQHLIETWPKAKVPPEKAKQTYDAFLKAIANIKGNIAQALGKLTAKP